MYSSSVSVVVSRFHPQAQNAQLVQSSPVFYLRRRPLLLVISVKKSSESGSPLGMSRRAKMASPPLMCR
jgi:hypothetical protein